MYNSKDLQSQSWFMEINNKVAKGMYKIVKKHRRNKMEQS